MLSPTSLGKVASLATHSCLKITLHLVLASVLTFAGLLYIPRIKETKKKIDVSLFE